MNQEVIWDKLYKHLTWKKETSTLVKNLKGKKVLELGVGTGKTLSSILAQKPCEVFAIDFSKASIRKCRERFRDKIILLREEARALPFKDSSFDVVVAYYILNNVLEEDRIKIVSEIVRVLKKGGMCLFEDFSINDFRNSGGNYQSDKNTVIKKNGLICHFFNEDELKELFGGFSEIKINKHSFNPIRKDPGLKRELIRLEGKK